MTAFALSLACGVLIWAAVTVRRGERLNTGHLWPALSVIAFGWHPLGVIAFLFAWAAAYCAWRTVCCAYGRLPRLWRAVRSPAGVGFAGLGGLPALGLLPVAGKAGWAIALAWCLLAVGLAGLAVALYRYGRSGAVQRALLEVGLLPRD